MIGVYAGFAVGCSDLVTFPIEPPPSGTETVLLAVEGSPPRVFGGPVRVFTRDVDIQGDELLFVGYYDTPLDELGGMAQPSNTELVPLILADTGTSLDDFMEGWTRRVGSSDAWQRTQETPPEFSGVFLATKEEGPCRELLGGPLRTEEAACESFPDVPEPPMLPEDPRPPVAPSFACRLGESTRAFDSGVTGCVAFDPPAPTCDDDARFDFATGACVAVDAAACTFAGLPAGAIHVDASVAPGGDGSAANPHHDLAIAIAAATSGDTIALAPGRYAAGTWALPDGVTIVGQCAPNTVVAAPRITLASGALERVTLEADTVELIAGATSTVRQAILATPQFVVGGALDLASSRVRGGGATALDLVQVGETGEATLTGVTLGPAHGNTFNVVGGRAVLTDVAMFGATTVSEAGLGLVAQMGADVTLNSVTIDDTDRLGMLVSSSTVVFDRVAVRDRGVTEDAEDIAVAVYDGSGFRGRDLFVAATRRHGVLVSNATARVEGLIVEDTVPSTAPGSDLIAVVAIDAFVALDDVHVYGRPAALVALEDAQLVASDLVVEGTPGPHAFYGVIARSRSSLDLARVIVRNVHSVGVAAVGEGTTARIEDLVVDGVRGASGDSDGISVQGASVVEVFRARVKDVVGRGVNVTGEGARLTLEDAEISGVRKLDDDNAYLAGSGMIAGPETTFTLRRAHLHDNTFLGLLGYAATPVVIEDVRVETTTLRRGLHVENDTTLFDEITTEIRRVHVKTTRTEDPEGVSISSAFASFGVSHMTATITDITIEDAEYYGVRLDSTGRDVSLDRVDVRRTRGTSVILDNGTTAVIKNLYVTEGTNGFMGASALNAVKCRLRLEDFRFESNRTIGLQLEKEQTEISDTMLERGVIVDNVIAVQVPVVETSEIRAVQVYLQDNARTFNTP